MNNAFLDLKNQFQEIKRKGWIPSCTKGNSGVGITFEKLLGKEVENFEIADYFGIEIKTKCSKREPYLSLFNATPDSYLFEIKRLQKNYGYPDKEYPQFKVFNVSVYCTRKVYINKNYLGQLSVDYKHKNITLNIYDNQYKLIDNLSAWSFDMLEEKLYRKLKYLAFVQADRKYELGQVYFRYHTIYFYRLKSFDDFIKLIENGFIRISFSIGVYKHGRKFGQIYDHGTTFNIKEDALEMLFDHVKLL